ncbi:MAG: hypothetical protein R2759_16295 [Bacteroidales bacterium]
MAAQKQFEFVIQSIENPESPLRVNAEYYEALCVLELYNSDAEYKLASLQAIIPPARIRT